MSSQATKPFRELRFGKTSAEAESAVWPDLLKHGYFDPYGLVQAARDPGRFLFLGYKGSGKSAIGEHLRLSAESDSLTFAKYHSLGDFPFTPFSKVIKGDVEPEAKYPTAWAWLIFVQLIDSLANDQGSSFSSDLELSDIRNALKDAGMLPADSLKQTVQITTNRSFKLSLKFLQFETGKTTVEAPTVNIASLVEKIKTLLLRVRTNSRHLLILDGLDEIQTKRDVKYESLAALIYEVNRLNQAFVSHLCPIKIIVLCRTDLYECLPSANKNKIRQDSAIHLDWFSDPQSPESSNLVKLVNHRVGLELGTKSAIDAFSLYLPKTISQNRRSVNTHRFLLDFTRHTPRDFITLLNYIQQATADDQEVTEASIVSAVRSYSSNYFVPEIIDELEGYMSRSEISELMTLLGGLGKREFSFSDLSTYAMTAGVSVSIDLAKSLHQMFECSAIGNVETIKGITYFTTKYRNRNSVLNLGKKLILHKGTWKALNLK